MDHCSGLYERDVAVAFEGDTVHALATYGGSGTAQEKKVKYRTWEGSGWSNETAAVSSKKIYEMTLDSYPTRGTDDLMFLFEGDDGRLYGSVWNGGVWETPTWPEVANGPGSGLLRNWLFLWDSVIQPTTGTVI